MKTSRIDNAVWNLRIEKTQPSRSTTESFRHPWYWILDGAGGIEVQARNSDIVVCVALLGWLRDTTSCGRSLKIRAASREGGVRRVAGLVSGEETIV